MIESSERLTTHAARRRDWEHVLRHARLIVDTRGMGEAAARVVRA
jgi:hypothetical protein